MSCGSNYLFSQSVAVDRGWLFVLSVSFAVCFPGSVTVAAITKEYLNLWGSQVYWIYRGSVPVLKKNHFINCFLHMEIMYQGIIIPWEC